MSEKPDEPNTPATERPDEDTDEFHLDPPKYDKVREGGDWKPIAGNEEAAE
ncbi:hypothetical protein [Nocardioides aurantiacus]|uniref:Uncharacterized protein n=1 Tax=Nocardioides aurantiacus TaxID=86796 RepID=A0A3N2CU47_9ACTN|nr:hypothetical protein [Nocardioides aurantiacus]ROR90928.1 hypothetical protein EDD33_1784 [Nocardioides aurantiacus]